MKLLKKCDQWLAEQEDRDIWLHELANPDTLLRDGEASFRIHWLNYHCRIGMEISLSNAWRHVIRQDIPAGKPLASEEEREIHKKVQLIQNEVERIQTMFRRWFGDPIIGSDKKSDDFDDGYRGGDDGGRGANLQPNPFFPGTGPALTVAKKEPRENE